MEISFRDAVTVLHGVGFGALLLLAFSGAFVCLYSSAVAGHNWTARQQQFAGFYFAGMAILAWAAVLIGAFVVYPWYHAVPPAGTIDLSGYPKQLLMSKPSTIGWHTLGMEWKEHIAWFAPIALTAATYVVTRYGGGLSQFRGLRNAVISLVLLAFVAAGVAGVYGVMLNKYAPVRGGRTITLMSFKAPDHE